MSLAERPEGGHRDVAEPVERRRDGERPQAASVQAHDRVAPSKADLGGLLPHTKSTAMNRPGSWWPRLWQQSPGMGGASCMDGLHLRWRR